MTVEEQRRAIKNHCSCRRLCTSGDKSGVECPLFSYPGLIDDGYDCYEAPDELTPKLYEVLFGKPEHDPVNHPSHYTQGGMECIDEMILIFGKEAVKNFCLCNAWKYRKRALFKNGQEDINKSDWYLAKYKELEGA